MIEWTRTIASPALVVLLLCPQNAFASCQSSGRPLCQLYEDYSVVFDGTVVSIENIDLAKSISLKFDPIPHRVATFDVHRAWKGVSGDRVQLLLRGGRVGKDERYVEVSEQLALKRGDRYVIFGTAGEAGYVTGSACSPSIPYPSAVKVLEFLYSLDRPPTGGVLTGRVRTFWRPLVPDAAEPEPGATRVTLAGMDLRRSVVVNDGPFEFGGLPPGTYAVSIARPPGMINTPPQTVTIASSRSCEDLFIGNVPDTRVSGVVRLMDGKPLEGVAILVDGEAMSYTNAAGFFQVDGIAPGRYVVVKTLRIEPEDAVRTSVYEQGNKPLEVAVAIRKPANLGVLRFGPLFGVTLELELRPLPDPAGLRPALR